MSVGLQDFFHIIIAVLNLRLHGSFPVFPVQKIGALLKQLLFLLKQGPVMVPDDVFGYRLLHIPFNMLQVEEALLPFCIHGILENREHRLEFKGNQHGIDHGALGRTRMGADAVYGKFRPCRVECPVLYVPKPISVHSVGKIRAEQLHIKMRRSLADLLVRGKANPDLSVLYFRMLQQVFAGSHNLRNPRLVVASQKRGAVGYNQILSPVTAQFRIVGCPENNMFLFVQYNIVSVIIFHNSGLHIPAGHHGSRIHMGNQSKHRRVFTALGSRHGCIDIAVLPVIGNLRRPHGFQLRCQKLCQFMLLLRTGRSPCIILRPGINLYILQKIIDGF